MTCTEACSELDVLVCKCAALSKWKPLLTDEEQDEQYWAVIKQGRENLDANSGANTVR